MLRHDQDGPAVGETGVLVGFRQEVAAFQQGYGGGFGGGFKG